MKAVLFDMDGVLVDSENFYMKGTYDWISKKGFKGKFEDVFILVGTTLSGTYKLLYEMLDEKYSIEEISKMNEEYFSKTNPIDYKKIMKNGVVELLSFLKENGVQMALCSSSPMYNIKKVLTDCEIISFFDYIISGEDLKESKPNPEIYLKAMERLKVSPKDCFVIEDSTMGIEAGKRAGVEVIAIRDFLFNQDQTRADYIVDDLFGALKILNIDKK